VNHVLNTIPNVLNVLLVVIVLVVMNMKKLLVQIIPISLILIQEIVPFAAVLFLVAELAKLMD